MSEERDVSRIRQEIIDNANKSMSLKDRERRIDAKQARLKKEYDTLKQYRRKHAVEQVDDGNIRVIIYIPRFLRSVILVNWFVVFPSIVALGSDNPGNIVYVPVILLVSLIGLLLAVVGWYIYWWLMAISLTIGTMLLLILLYTGAIEANRVRDAFQSMFGG